MFKSSKMEIRLLFLVLCFLFFSALAVAQTDESAPPPAETAVSDTAVKDPTSEAPVSESTEMGSSSETPVSVSTEMKSTSETPASESTEMESASKAPVSVNSEKESTIETLKTLLFTKKEIEEEIKLKKHERKISISPEDKAALNDEIIKLKDKLTGINNDFESIITGVDIHIFSDKPKAKFDWKEELTKLLAPLVSELRDMTARPRQIEAIRSEIAYQQKLLDTTRKAIQNIDQLLKTLPEDELKLKKNLAAVQEYWVEKEKRITDQLKIEQYQLEDLMKERKSLLESSQEFIKSFFKSRGQNITLAFLAFLATFLLLRYIHRLIYRHSPIHKRGDRSFLIRVGDIAYHLLTVLASMGALLFVLYTSGDWLLLSIAIIFLLGIAWTAKEGLPRFWRQIQLMLNLGTVKETERIVYNGVPWRVKSLNVSAFLENPMLKPSELRVPLRDMLDLNSRPYDESEPWFPSNMNEWVILSDGTRGEVISQTPEMVQLQIRGGSVKTYPAGDYLGMNPLNISKNFRLKIVFGFDYNLQSVITTKVPEILSASLKKGLEAAGYGDDLRQLKVEIETAGASSIDLLILSDFTGKVAPLYNAIKRLIQKLTIETASENDWGIPYPQVTVHTPEVLRIEKPV